MYQEVCLGDGEQEGDEGVEGVVQGLVPVQPEEGLGSGFLAEN